MSGFGQLDLWRLAGKRSYERGEAYVDAVTGLRRTDRGVRATVHGSEPYRVSLDWADGPLTGRCSCPYAQEGNFCKHCVAVGLCWMDSDEQDFDDDPPTEQIRAYLMTLEHSALVELLCEQAAQDGWLYEDLSDRAASLANGHHGQPS